MKEEQIEKLLEKWVANKELNHKKHPLPVLISIGWKEIYAVVERSP